MPFDDLFEEGRRQLTICNSCRYCAGYCPVWPAMERRPLLTLQEQVHMANLCHDCRDCFTACMYTPPHEFDLNPPKVFTEIREYTYRAYIGPQAMHRVLESRWGTVAVSVLAVVFVAAVSGLTGGTLMGRVGGDPYSVIGHTIIIASALAASLFAIGVVLVGMARYWRDTHGPLRDLFDLGAWGRTLGLAARLEHQSGAEEGCAYEDNEPKATRKVAHQLIMYGFLLTFASTTSAAIMENVLGLYPPYPVLSVPVVLGSVGGIMAIVGCVISLRAKKQSDASLTTRGMLRADRALLWALLFINLSGMFTLVFRETAAFGWTFVVHFAAVLVFFVFAPYTKFVHWVFRVLATYKDVLETAPLRAAGTKVARA